MAKRHVYIIKMINTNFYKIGISNDLNERLSDLQTATPFELKLIYEKLYEDFFLIENFVQNSFAKKHVRGEWFELSIYDINSLISFLKNLDNVAEISKEIRVRLASVKKHHNDDIRRFRRKVQFKDLALYPANQNLNSRWHITYYARMETDEKYTRFRVYGGLNRIKDKAVRISTALHLMTHVTRALDAGYNPFVDKSNILDFAP